MAVVRFLAVALFVAFIVGCQSLVKDDPILGDHPWQPGSPPPQKFRSDTSQ